MKCGLIWARSARSSASMTRVRVRASSASASWLDTQAATSSVARARPGRGFLGPRGEGADDEVVHDERGRDGAADRAVRVGAGHVAVVVHHGAAGLAGLLAQGEGRAAVVVADAGPGQHAAGVGDRHGVRAEDGEQVPPGLLRGIRGEAVAEVLRGEGCRVQRRVGGPVDLGEEPASAAAPQQPHREPEQQHRAGDEHRRRPVDASRHGVTIGSAAHEADDDVRRRTGGRARRGAVGDVGRRGAPRSVRGRRGGRGPRPPRRGLADRARDQRRGAHGARGVGGLLGAGLRRAPRRADLGRALPLAPPPPGRSRCASRCCGSGAPCRRRRSGCSSRATTAGRTSGCG